MPDPIKFPPEDNAPQSSRLKVSAAFSRRRLLKSGAAVAPVLLTLVSRPVLGGTCVSTSEATSLTGSQLGGEQQVCAGRTPGYWKQPQHFGEWTPPYTPGESGKKDKGDAQLAGASISPATVFHSGETGLLQGPHADFGTATLLQVMSPELFNQDIDGMGRHIAAALLNAAAGLTPVLDESAVRRIWNDWSIHGYYEPTAGVRWSSGEIVDYLLTTMD